MPGRGSTKTWKNGESLGIEANRDCSSASLWTALAKTSRSGNLVLRT
jgi:hypothetical protein